MSFRIYQIQQGVAVEAVAEVQLLPSGSTGVAGALRRLVHPDGGLLPPLVYYRNPDRTFNFDNDVLRHPITSVTRTLSSSRTVRFEEVTEDVIVTERWEAGGGLSMPGFMFRQLYNYLVNPPAFSAVAQTYIIWEPRDETDDTYEVEVIGLQVGSGPGRFSIKKHVARGGASDPQTPGTLATPTDTMDVAPTYLLDQPVDLTMRIISRIEG